MALKQPLLQVVEGCNGFYIYHNPSGRCKGMGDGVGMRFVPVVGQDSVCMGDEGFVEFWQADVDENMGEYMEAYFHELYELEVYHAPAGAMEPGGRLFVARWVCASVVTGIFVWPGENRWRAAPLFECELAQADRAPYTDLSWAEQEAIADALDEYEEGA